MLPPGAITAGVNVTVGTVRSGRSTVSVPVRNVLLLSSASMTAPPASAVTLILYAPSVVPAGIVTAFAKAIVAPAARLTPVRLGPIGMSLPPGLGYQGEGHVEVGRGLATLVLQRVHHAHVHPRESRWRPCSRQ